MQLMKRGVCGVDLKNQVIVIGFLYSALAIFGLVFGFFLLQSPEYFANSPAAREESWRNEETQELINEQQETNDEELGNLLDKIKKEESESKTEDFNELNKPQKNDKDSNKKEDESNDIAVESREQEDETVKKQDVKDQTVEAQANKDQAVKDQAVEAQAKEDDFPNSLEGEDDKIITEENDEDIIKTEEVEQRHLEDMDDLNLDDLNRKKRSVETMDNTNTTTDAKDTHSFYKLLRFIQNEGVEVMISSLFRLCCSSLLIMGARSGRPWFLVPWLVEECIEMVGGALQFLLHMSRNGGWTFMGLLLISLLYALGAYFIFSVYSFHSKLRWMSRQSHEVISSVSQGGFQAGLNYQRLEDECWQTDPNLAREFDLRNSGFVRESKISVEEPDDYVLYVK